MSNRQQQIVASHSHITKYGVGWTADTHPLEIEMECIRRGGTWKDKLGRKCGEGLIHHFEQMRRIIWPNLHDHRWHRLCRDTILTNKISVLAGTASSGKTHEPAWIFLCDYWCFPDETCVLVSSTDIRGLKLRIWGEMTKLWQEGKDRFEFLAGHLLDSKIAITTDNLDDGDFGERKTRDMRKGIIGIPCVQGGKFVGLSKFIGIKQKRMRLLADESSAMSISFLSAFSNLSTNEDFWAVLSGNFNDPMDPLGKAAEPVDGWDNHLESDKTSVWDTQFMDGKCVNLIGLDSPNFDFPDSEPVRYKYLPTRKKIEQVVKSYGKDSFEYYSQCVGTMKIATLDRRVLNRPLCRKHGVQEDVIWEGSERTKICGIDAAYGGDRCVGGHIEFGKDSDGQIVLKVHPPYSVPISVKPGSPTPEDQIAVWVKDYCESNDIPPENFFHDSTGRGSLGTALGQVWSSNTNPIEFGGSPTKRPVHQGEWLIDTETGEKRLKRCDEHYDRFVTELWYSIRYTAESNQLKNLPDEVMDELCSRDWDRPKHSKIILEKKQDMKKRVGYSPDLGDWLAICVEGARRRGFVIDRLGKEIEGLSSNEDFFETEAEEYAAAIKGSLLNHTV